MSGFVTIHRKILGHPLFVAKPKARMVFQDLILLAAFTNCQQDWRGRPVQLKRGQVMISVAEICKRTTFSTREIRTILNQLANYEMVKIDKANDKAPSIITICNYSKYQDLESETDKANDNHPTKTRQTKEQVKPVKQKKDNPLNPPSGDQMRFSDPYFSEGVHRADDGRIVLSNGTRQEWLERFGGDAERLDLALLEVGGQVQPNSRQPLRLQAERALARICGDRNDKDRRYNSAVASRSQVSKEDKIRQALRRI